MSMFSFIPPWLLLSVASTFLFYVYLSRPYTFWSKRKVKGPPPSLIVGNLKEWFDPKIGEVTTVDKWKAQYGPIIGAYFLQFPMLIVNDLEVLKRVLIKDFSKFTDRWFIGDGFLIRPILKKGVFFETGANWKRIRRIMSSTFTSGKLKLVIHHVNRTSRYLGESVEKSAKEGRSVEAKTVFGAYALDVICGSAFGLDTNSQHDYQAPFIKTLREMFNFGIRLQIILMVASVFPWLCPVFRKLGVGLFRQKHMEFVEESISAIITERKANPELQKSDDYLQLLMNAEDESEDGQVDAKKLSTAEIVAQGIVFINGGYETTSTALQFLSYEVARHSEVQAKLIEEIIGVVGWDDEPTYEQCLRMKYLEAVIYESLRRYPPLNFVTREAAEEVTLNGITIPKGTFVMIPIANVLLDPENFEDPMTFNPERFLTDDKQTQSLLTVFPFGIGPRQCMGMRLAMMEIKIALVHVLRRVELVWATPDELVIENYASMQMAKWPIHLQLKARERC